MFGARSFGTSLFPGLLIGFQRQNMVASLVHIKTTIRTRQIVGLEMLAHFVARNRDIDEAQNQH
jgi:hypothetical protein